MVGYERQTYPLEMLLGSCALGSEGYMQVVVGQARLITTTTRSRSFMMQPCTAGSTINSSRSFDTSVWGVAPESKLDGTFVSDSLRWPQGGEECLMFLLVGWPGGF